METQVNELLDSGVTSNRTRGYALTFGGTEGSMLGQNDDCLVGGKTNWWLRTNLVGKKKQIWWERRIGAPTKTNLAGTKNWRPDKNYFGGNTYYDYDKN